MRLKQESGAFKASEEAWAITDQYAIMIIARCRTCIRIAGCLLSSAKVRTITAADLIS
jgi:hypothetical protein